MGVTTTNEAVALESPDDIALADRLKLAGGHSPECTSSSSAGGRIDLALCPSCRGNSCWSVSPDREDPLIHYMARCSISSSSDPVKTDLMPGHHGHRHHPGRSEGVRRRMCSPRAVFTNILLGRRDQRTPPKTQSALRRAMQEHRVTVQGKTFKLEEPFIVYATQNPIESKAPTRCRAPARPVQFEIRLDYLTEERRSRRAIDDNRR